MSKIKVRETKLRTAVKTILLRIIVFTIITLFVIFFMDGSVRDGIEIGVLDIIIELITYFVYERIWMKISWGIIIKQPNDPNKTYNVIDVPQPIQEENPNIIQEEPQEQPEPIEVVIR